MTKSIGNEEEASQCMRMWKEKEKKEIIALNVGWHFWC